ncbi:hypothetical protein M6B38_386955 [Iris pallida]|uniref:Uncharacterized protein n=1 Tax=Iris pallida TaxID=29817 RepID=A0AAX6G1L2_IRIPA|nr:hypothetical protein M6B38_386955 [Iris pallida]
MALGGPKDIDGKDAVDRGGGSVDPDEGVASGGPMARQRRYSRSGQKPTDLADLKVVARNSSEARWINLGDDGCDLAVRWFKIDR